MNFWVSWYSWCENYPKTDFKYWNSGTGMRYRPLPSKKISEETFRNKLKAFSAFFRGDDSDPGIGDWFDNNAISDGIFCALIEADNEEQVWEIISLHFPDYEERFCEEKPDLTHEKLAESGRFV